MPAAKKDFDFLVTADEFGQMLGAQCHEAALRALGALHRPCAAANNLSANRPTVRYNANEFGAADAADGADANIRWQEGADTHPGIR